MYVCVCVCVCVRLCVCLLVCLPACFFPLCVCVRERECFVCVRACLRDWMHTCVRVSNVLVSSYFIPSLSLFVYSLATFNTVSVSVCACVCAFECLCMCVCRCVGVCL